MSHSRLAQPAREPRAYPGVTATARVMAGLSLYGHAPSFDEPDTRALPEYAQLDAIVQGLFDGLIEPLSETRLERDLDDLLWSLADLFHRKADRVQRMLHDNEARQRQSQEEQDGSEVRSVELERLIDKGVALVERRNAFERMRDRAGEAYEAHTGTAWRPRSGSLVNRKAMTASMIDSRDFIAAQRRAETELHLPPGTKVAFSGGTDCNDHDRIWAVLDRVRAKHPDMVLLHGGTASGAERIAACWADSRKVVHIAFKPDWARDKKAAPFKRNDRMLEAMPVGVVVFPGSGITANLADKARKMGLPVLDHSKGV